MGIVTLRGVFSHARISLFLGLSFFVTSCAYIDGWQDDNGDDQQLSTQQKLLDELEQNRLLWAQSGVSEYTYTLQKDCDCPDEIKTTDTVSVNDQPQEISDGTGTSPKAKVLARDGNDEQRTAQNASIESYFTDLRQAIQQNSVQQVQYNPVYGYPQNVVLNTSTLSQPQFVGQTTNQQAINYGNNNRPVSNLTLQTQQFQVLNTRAQQPGVTLNGQFIRQINPTNNNIEDFWLVENDGRWNELSVAQATMPAVAGIANRSNVQVSGQWVPGGASGLGRINLQNIQLSNNNPLQTNLNGTLFYNVQNNNSSAINNFFLNSDDGRQVQLDVPDNLRNQAFGFAGQRINLTGNWNGNFNNTNARFIPNQFNSLNNQLQQFTGILRAANSGNGSATSPNVYTLIDDFGTSIQVQIPNSLLNNSTYLFGQRVQILGTRIFNGNFGQAVVQAQSISPIQNFFTNSQISGTIITVLLGNGYNNFDQVMLQLDTGNSILVQIPFGLSTQNYPLTAGMRILVNGVWVNNQISTQGVFEARTAIQILNLGYTGNQNFNGYISNIGSFSNGSTCTGTQNNFTFTTDSGQSYQLYLGPNVNLNGLGNLSALGYQSRLQVSGTILSPGVLQANSITAISQPSTTITGTIVNIGPAGNAFSCLGTLYSYRILDQFGNAYSVTTNSNTLGGSSTYLKIGDVVNVIGSMNFNGNSFYAQSITRVSSTVVPPQYQPPLQPPVTNSNQSFMGTVTGFDCENQNSESYIFIDQSGRLYTLSVNLNLLGGNYWINIGSQVQVSGSLIGNQIVANQINQVLTFADPVNRIPVSGTITNLISSTPTQCANPVNTYQFQTDTGQIYQLRLTYEAANNQVQVMQNGTRVTVTARLTSANPQIIDALQIQTLNTTPSLTGSVIPATLNGTIMDISCTNDIFFVDQNGNGYHIQPSSTTIAANSFNRGTRVNVTGQVNGNRILASMINSNSQSVFFPPPPPTYGLITSNASTETLNCGTVVSLVHLQNDNGRQQLLRLYNNNGNQFLGSGNRVLISNMIESFDGNVIDAININQARDY